MKKKLRNRSKTTISSKPLESLTDELSAGSAEVSPAVRVRCMRLDEHNGAPADRLWKEIFKINTTSVRDLDPVSFPNDFGSWSASTHFTPLVRNCMACASQPDSLRTLIPMAEVVRITKASSDFNALMPNVIRLRPGAPGSPAKVDSRRKPPRKQRSATESHVGAAADDPQAISGHFHIIGDLHGQLFDLIQVLSRLGRPSASNRYCFDGDFVDRGSHGVEVALVLMAMQLCWPKFVFMLRGNHESTQINYHCGFVAELRRKYGRKATDRTLGVAVPRSAPFHPSPDIMAALTRLQEVAEEADLPSDQVQPTALFSNFQWVWRRLPVAVLLETVCLVVHGGLWRRPSELNDEESQCATAPSSPRKTPLKLKGANGPRKVPFHRRPSSSRGTASAPPSASKKPKSRHMQLGSVADMMDHVVRFLPEPLPHTPLADAVWSDPSPCSCQPCVRFERLSSGSQLQQPPPALDWPHLHADSATSDSRPPEQLRLNKLRGEGIRWNCAATQRFCASEGVRLVVRGHEGPSPKVSDEAMEQGINGPLEKLVWRVTRGWQLDHCGAVDGGACLTVFSAPQYPQFKSVQRSQRLSGVFGMPENTLGAVVSFDCNDLFDQGTGSLNATVLEYSLSAHTPNSSFAFYNFESKCLDD